MDTEQMLYEIIDRVGKTQDDMRDILVAMQADLKYHIKRTDLLEEQVELLRAEIRQPFPWKPVAAIITTIAAIIGTALKVLGQ